MKLVGSHTSPFVRKVRVVMAEKKLDYDFQLEDVWSLHEPHADNPLGKVPCLMLDGGDSVFDSSVIVEYLDALSPVSNLIPSRGRERAEVRTWEALADGAAEALISARLEQTWAGRSDSQRCSAWVDRQILKVHAALIAMERGLADKPWCSGAHFSLADVAVGCTLGYLDFRFPDLKWRQDHANLAKLADKLFARHSFIDTLPPV